MEIIPAKPEHWPEIWAIFEPILADGTTYAYTPESMPEGAARAYLMETPGTQGFVAVENGAVVGFYAMRPNQRGRGNHVANASFMVRADQRGRGIARALGEHAKGEAKRQGFKAMQFNFVVSTNEVAVKRWQGIGFNIIGTIPGGFQHPDGRLVDVYVMHQFL